MYDIIGDIHGYAGHLEKLLRKMGYEKNGKGYSHPERTAVFVGDFIDRGPEIGETLKIVRNMTEQGKALAVMGNHEYNALCYHTKNEKGEYLRKHTENNTNQHIETLKQFENNASDWKSHLNWFHTLPLYLDLNEIRIVHACWDSDNIEALGSRKTVTEEFLLELNSEIHYKKSSMYTAVDECIKGREEIIPNGYSFKDKHGKERNEMRVCWYLDPGKSYYNEYYMEEIAELRAKKVDAGILKKKTFYGDDEKPVFCGHYWFEGIPKKEKHNVACVDYSIGKGGKLAAYRWSGEKELKDENFVWVNSNGD